MIPIPHFYYTCKLRSYHHPGELNLSPTIIADYQKTNKERISLVTCRGKINYICFYNDPDQCNVMGDSWCGSEKSVSAVHHPDTYVSSTLT